MILDRTSHVSASSYLSNVDKLEACLLYTSTTLCASTETCAMHTRSRSSGGFKVIISQKYEAVSYTHLDVYKRQVL